MNSYLPLILLTVFAVNELHAHDTFLRLTSYHLQPNTQTSVSLMNGTIEVSENSVALDRFRDVRIVGPSFQIESPNNRQWAISDKLSKLDFTTGETGSYSIGVSIKPRKIEMSSDKFNKYLKHCGVVDVLKDREKNNPKNLNVVEKYSKHVKAFFQVGKFPTESYHKPFNYPIEIIPQSNPCSLRIEDILPVKVYLRGKPLSNQHLYASYVGFHKHEDNGLHVEAVHTKTDEQGSANIKISKKGIWYIRLIHMVASEEDGIDYESNWATLTFEVT